VVTNRPLSASSTYYDPWHPPFSIHVPDSLFSTIYLHVSFGLPLGWHPPLHSPYVSSPNHSILFTTHAHTITTCFSVVPRLCHLIPVSLSTLYLEFYLVVSCHTSILPFSSLPSEVSPHFRFLWARSHFHATYYYTHNRCTISLS